MDGISLGGILTRIGAALLLVFATFNPSGYSYFHWLRGDFPSVSAPQAVVGILLLIPWIFLWRSMMQAVGKLGLVLMAALFAAIVWMFVGWGWIDPANTGAMTWVALAVVGLILGIGMSWAIIRRDLTGQASVDDVDGHH